MTRANGRKIAQVRDILEDVRASGAETVEAQLTVLFDKFNTAARAIDPSIKGSWMGRDMTLENKPYIIGFERDGQLGSAGEKQH